jgi:RNA polymerase sigma factor (TIGR02999 family)
MPVSLSSPDPGPLSQLLDRAKSGDPAAEAELFQLAEHELKQMARKRLAAERDDHTLQPTALVNEVYLRLFRGADLQGVSGRLHFFALASKVMRQILVDHARKHHASRRGGEMQFVDLEFAELQPSSQRVDLVDLDRSLSKLEAASPRAGRLVELCFFTGLTIADAAEVLGVSSRTLHRDWKIARAMLFKEIYGDAGINLGPTL